MPNSAVRQFDNCPPTYLVNDSTIPLLSEYPAGSGADVYKDCYRTVKSSVVVTAPERNNPSAGCAECCSDALLRSHFRNEGLGPSEAGLLPSSGFVAIALQTRLPTLSHVHRCGSSE